MIDLYKIEKDKYGEYYVSYGKKHRIKTLEKKKEKIQQDIDKLFTISFYDSFAMSYRRRLESMINWKIIYINGNKYIQWGSD